VVRILPPCFILECCSVWWSVLIDIVSAADVFAMLTDCSASSRRGWWLFCTMHLAFLSTIIGWHLLKLSKVIRCTGRLEHCCTKRNIFHSGINFLYYTNVSHVDMLPLDIYSVCLLGKQQW